MIELFVSVCLITDPANCRDVRLDYSLDATSMRECVYSSQLTAARWSGDNPDWQVHRLSCTRPSQTAQADGVSRSQSQAALVTPD
jgi:hypothetical protein